MKNITKICDFNIKELFLQKDKNNRKIYIYNLENFKFVKGYNFYPNVLLTNNEIVINPIEEITMSLKEISDNNQIYFDDIKSTNRVSNPVFYFIYNTDNYFHFIYDSLPYLISFFQIKKKYPDLKLLMNYPNYQKTEFYQFTIEFLELIGISQKEIILLDETSTYDKIFVSSSFTHGVDSNLSPREEIYLFYDEIIKKIKKNTNKKFPEKIYISRRTWINKDFKNIGTNYTTKRKCENEDELVEFLNSQGYTEVFTESLSTVEKILLFNNAKSIIGTIGGGLCNTLFCNENTELICIVSPTFFDVNERFKFSFKKIKVNYFNKCNHFELNEWKKFMRVSTDSGIIGEITNVDNDELTVSYVDKKVSGWNNEFNLKSKNFNKKNCKKLDNGLNSSWIILMDSFISFYNNLKKNN
jgi:hypothetical protein